MKHSSKKLKHKYFMKTFIILVLSMIFSQCNYQTKNHLISQSLNNENDCLTKENFNIVKDYILKNGEQVKLYKAGIMADTTTLSMQLLLENVTIAFVEYETDNRIILIQKDNKKNIPTYFVSNKNKRCEISAYYSELETEESIRLRKDDWCKIVIKIKNDKNNSLALIDKKAAIEIAQKDALLVYRDLSIYNIKAELKDKKWYVDYNLTNPNMVGGGPHYIISGKTGMILSKKYEQ